MQEIKEKAKESDMYDRLAEAIGRLLIDLLILACH